MRSYHTLGCSRSYLSIDHKVIRPKPDGPKRHTEGRSRVDLFEYQARDMFERYEVPVLGGLLASTPQEAVAAAEKLGGGTVVVKAQVKIGGRGKAGGVQLAHLPTH